MQKLKKETAMPLLVVILILICPMAMMAELSEYTITYIEAIRQRDMGNDSTAFNLFRHCLELNPDGGETHDALADYYRKMQQDSLALYHQKRSVELQPRNPEFAEKLARSYLYKDSIDKAAEVYEELVKQLPDRTDCLEILMRIYQQQHDYPKMLSALNRMEIQEGKSEDVTLTKMQVYSYMGNQNGAYNELKSLIDAHPFDLNLRVMMGNWLYSNGRKAEALATLQNVLSEEPDNAQAQMSLMDYHRMEGHADQADSLLYSILINPRTESDTRLASVKAWVNDPENGADSLRVMQMFNKVLALPNKDPDVAVMRASYLMSEKAPNDTIRKALRTVLDIQPENLWARLNLLQIMWKDSIDEDVVRECKMAVEYIPDDPALYYYLAMAQTINKHDDDALATIYRGIDQIKSDTKKELSADLYSALGDILQKRGKTDEAFDAYEKSLLYSPNRSMTLNNYAYFLSLKKENLKKAEQMSYRAITAEANNATYLDTYAWILYQQNRYEEAKIYIEQALKAVADDTTQVSGDIYEHAGDIYYRLGQTLKAREYWMKALPLGVDDEARLRRKINKGKI